MGFKLLVSRDWNKEAVHHKSTGHYQDKFPTSNWKLRRKESLHHHALTKCFMQYVRWEHISETGFYFPSNESEIFGMSVQVFLALASRKCLSRRYCCSSSVGCWLLLFPPLFSSRHLIDRHQILVTWQGTSTNIHKSKCRYLYLLFPSVLPFGLSSTNAISLT